MKPIAQTFLVSQPNTGIDGVFLSKIKFYFRSVSSVYGITLEIRATDNGFPTPNMIAGSRVHLPAGGCVASSDASAATEFIFPTMPFLQANVQYAMVLIPDGGNDEFDVWTGELGGQDILTNTPIFNNNSLGNLFISSNDLVFTPIITESIKYEMYTAQFTEETADITVAVPNVEFLKVANVVGIFHYGEQAYVANSVLTPATTNSSSNTIVVANSAVADLANNTLIFLSTPDRSAMSVHRVINQPNSTVVTVNPRPAFSNTGAVYGRIHGDGSLRAQVGNAVRYSPFEDWDLSLSQSTANTTLNFAGHESQYVIGSSSGASAILKELVNRPFDSITPSFTFVKPKETGVFFDYVGVANDVSYTADSAYTPATPNVPNEFVDHQRVIMSRSNELTQLAGGRAGDQSVKIRMRLTTANNQTAPFADTLGKQVTFTYNQPTTEAKLNGIYLPITNASASFTVGEQVSQNTSFGTVDFANTTFIRVIDTSGTFQANSTTIIGGTSSANALIQSVTSFNEAGRNGLYSASRYISKNVTLADKQDAEDLVTFFTGYRAVGSNFMVYAKFLNGADPEPFDTKSWSRLKEDDISVALFSSPINRDDIIEMQFSIPVSVEVDPNGAVTNSSANTIVVGDTSFYSVNDYIYIADTLSSQFNVRQVSSIANNSALVLKTNPSYTSANVSVGVIPGLESQTGAFKYSRNNNILRYATATDAYYDSYKVFAVKWLPVSNNSVIVPIMQDMRCLALQV